MKEINIHVTKTGYEDGLDGTWLVIFTEDRTRIDKKDVTFCAIRKADGLFFNPSAGCAVRKPSDIPGSDGYDPDAGIRTAFKRAVQAVLRPLYFPEDVEKYIIDRFRGALWIAMGRPGYKKEPIRGSTNFLEQTLTYEGE